MAQNIVNNLFGIDPEALQQQRAATDFSNAFKFAQLDPLQRANLAIYQGSAGLGRAATQLLGGDEQLNRATKVRELSSQFDMTNPDGLRQFAQAIAPFAPDVAQQAIKRSDEMRLTAANIFQKSGENINTLISSGKYTPESLAAYRQSRDPADLVLVEKGKTIGLSVDGQQVYQSGDSQYILGPGGQRVPYYGRLESKTPKTEVNLGSLGDLFAKESAKASAKDVTDQISKAQDALKTSSKVSRDIDEIERILPNTFTGQFANFSKTASKTLSALGIPISDKASNTEILQALTNNLVLPAVKQLPGSLAAKELAFLQQTKPEALQEPATIKRLLTLLKEDISVNRALVKRADEYQKADKLGTLQGFNIALQQDSIYQDLRTYNALKTDVRNGKKITKAQADFAKKVEQELGLQ